MEREGQIDSTLKRGAIGGDRVSVEKGSAPCQMSEKDLVD